VKVPYHHDVDYVDKICSLELSPRVVQGIRELFSELCYVGETEESIRINVLLCALNRKGGNYIEDDHKGQFKLMWDRLDKIKSEGGLSKFEEEYVLPEIDRQKKTIDFRLRRAFLERLSPPIRKRFYELESGDRRFTRPTWSIRLDCTREELKEILDYSDTKFSRYEQETFLPLLETVSAEGQKRVLREAVRFANKMRNENEKIADRAAAREAVRIYFPGLKGEGRKRKIDTVRKSMLARFGKRKKRKK